MTIADEGAVPQGAAFFALRDRIARGGPAARNRPCARRSNMDMARDKG